MKPQPSQGFMARMTLINLLRLSAFVPSNSFQWSYVMASWPYIVKTVFLQPAFVNLVPWTIVIVPVFLFIFICVFLYVNHAVCSSIWVIRALVSRVRLTILALLPVVALFMIIVLMVCRLPEQSYFSCLKRSGRQEHKHIVNSRRLVALVPPDTCFALRIKRRFDLVTITIKLLSRLNRLRLCFRYFPPRYL